MPRSKDSIPQSKRIPIINTLCSARLLHKLIFPSNDHFSQTRWFIVRSPFIWEWNWVCCNSVYLSTYLISGCLYSFQAPFLLKHRLWAVSGMEGLFYAPSGVCVGTGADQNGLWTLWTCHHQFPNSPSATLYTASANRAVAQMMLYWCINGRDTSRHKLAPICSQINTQEKHTEFE